MKDDPILSTYERRRLAEKEKSRRIFCKLILAAMLVAVVLELVLHSGQ